MRDKQSEPQMGQMGKVTLFKPRVNNVNSVKSHMGLL